MDAFCATRSAVPLPEPGWKVSPIHQTRHGGYFAGHMDHIKHIFDARSKVVVTFTIVGWFANVRPPLAALALILWIGVQFYHSDLMKSWRERKSRKGKQCDS